MSTFINDLPGAQVPSHSTDPPVSQPSSQLNPNTVNELINNINEASIKGTISLPPRDIPLQTEPDIESSPNYIPPTKDTYISETNESEIINSYNKKIGRNEKMDALYNELQTPILLAILYFLFQLPIFKMFLFKLLPFFFSKDGNSNVTGYFGFSILFGVSYFFINKILILINF